MKLRPTLMTVGILLMVLGGARLSLQLGLTGLANIPWAMFALGILICARASDRELAERVRVLESQIAHGRTIGDGAST
jgi:hypothetical protein